MKKQQKEKIILGIETSCDETAAAVLRVDRGFFDVASNVVASQIDIHQKYGGVVPEVAAREHVLKINPVIDEALLKANINHPLAPSLVRRGNNLAVDLIAVASGPGLITSLIVGVEAAKALSLAWQVPLVGINHMYGHLAANFLEKVDFPALSLVVSGGHTELILLKDYSQYKKIGQTIDDAAGEAFDKVAKMLGLGYPGGPVVSARAEESTINNPPATPERSDGGRGQQSTIKLPRPMLKNDDFNFSFSGLKTAVLYDFKKRSEKVRKSKEYISAMCNEFQQAVVDILVSKTIRAAKKYKVKTVMMAGGVAANKKLRETLKNKVEELGLKFLVPDFSLCTDNAVMIAIAGYYASTSPSLPRRGLGGGLPLDNWKKIKADPGWEL